MKTYFPPLKVVYLCEAFLTEQTELSQILIAAPPLIGDDAHQNLTLFALNITEYQKLAEHGKLVV